MNTLMETPMAKLRVVNGRLMTDDEPAVIAEGVRLGTEILKARWGMGLRGYVPIESLVSAGLTEGEAHEVRLVMMGKEPARMIDVASFAIDVGMLGRPA